ncbi:MAG: hypothetical protein WCA39_02740 [Nitrososphaeraceae archaeon]
MELSGIQVNIAHSKSSANTGNGLVKGFSAIRRSIGKRVAYAWKITMNKSASAGMLILSC